MAKDFNWKYQHAEREKNKERKLYIDSNVNRRQVHVDCVRVKLKL